MANAVLISVLMIFAPALSPAEVLTRLVSAPKGSNLSTPAPWITFRNLRDQTSFACDAMLAQPADTGRRLKGLQVTREVAIPKQVVAELINAAPATETPNLARRFLQRLRAFLGHAPAPAAREMNVLIEDVRAPVITPAGRAVLEHVAVRLDEIQDEQHADHDEKYLVRHLLRGRLKMQRYVAGLSAQAGLLQKHLLSEAANEPVALTTIPDLSNALTTEALAQFQREENGETAPPVAADFKDVKIRARHEVLGGALGGWAFINVFAMGLMDPKISLIANVALGAGLYYFSETFRDQVGRMIGGVKSLYRDLRAPPAPMTAAERLELRLDRNQNQINALSALAEHLAGKKPRRGFGYYAYEAETVGVDGSVTTVLNEHFVFTDLKQHQMITVVSKVDTRSPAFTRVEL